MHTMNALDHIIDCFPFACTEIKVIVTIIFACAEVKVIVTIIFACAEVKVIVTIIFACAEVKVNSSSSGTTGQSSIKE